MDIRVGSRTHDSKLCVEQMDNDELIDMAREALNKPHDAAFWDDDLYVTHTLMFYSAPDSDDLVSASNFHSILRDLKAAYPRAVEQASIGHWTYSHFDCVKVRVLYSDGTIHPAFADAAAIALSLRDYPLYDESDYSDREMEVWNTAILDAVSYAADDDDDDEIREAAQKYLWQSEQLVGYQEVGYVPDEMVTEALEHAREDRARAQAVGLTHPNNSGDTLPTL